jgi:hypothetical protein
MADDGRAVERPIVGIPLEGVRAVLSAAFPLPLDKPKRSEAYQKIAAGLEDVIAIVKGGAEPAKVHRPRGRPAKAAGTASSAAERMKAMRARKKGET